MSRGMEPRKAPRSIDPESPEGVYYGMSVMTAEDVSPVRGGDVHVQNAPTVRNTVLKERASKPEHRGIMAHGVEPDQHTTHERAHQEAHGSNNVKTSPPHYIAPDPGIPPVPVYVVAAPGGPRPLKTFAADFVTIPAQGNTPVRICSRDFNRTGIKVLVETQAGLNGAAPTGVRISRSRGDLDIGRGALLSSTVNSWVDFEVNDELFAISNDGSACTVTVLHLYQIDGAM